MKKNKILITIENKKDIDYYRSLGITNFVYPLKDFCVGYPNTFLADEIPSNSYLFINRILDNKSIDRLKIILQNIKNIKGIIFDDLGILEIIKNKDIEKILYLSHFNNNSASINIYLDYVDTVILSTDITIKEIKSIIKNVKKEISLFTFGHVGVMYSRRLLLDNYAKYFNILKENPLKIVNNDTSFLVFENDYGTYFYHNKIFAGKELMNLPAKYYFINTAFLEKEIVKDFLEGKKISNSDDGFLNKKTIYKLKGDKDE